MYSANQLSNLAANSKDVWIKANDVNKQLALINAKELAEALREASQVKDEMERFAVATGELFPNYSVEKGLATRK